MPVKLVEPFDWRAITHADWQRDQKCYVRRQSYIQDADVIALASDSPQP